MSVLKEPISKLIWDLKYRYRFAERIVDQTIEDTWLRVAKAAAKAEKAKDRSHYTQSFFQILENFQYLPGGRILAGAGTEHKVTLFNCFVMDIPEDSLAGIFTGLKEGALTLQQGGGVGYDFSVLRPKGSLARKTGLTSSGPVSFMRIWDTTCSILLSTGARRGAMMGVLRCDHPDIIEFIQAKRQPEMLRHFNVSVMIFDEFMRAVKDDTEWPLVFPVDHYSEADDIIFRAWGNSTIPVPCRVYQKVGARELWGLIIKSAYDYAEPGVLFADTINRMNNLYYCEYISATNPCGEIPLPPYGACDLGAINLTQFVTAPFSKQASINWAQLEDVTRIATRFQDNVIDVSLYPLSTQRQAAKNTRRIGLGITGLGDALVMMGLRYGDEASIDLAKQIMKCVAESTWRTSIELAKEKGAFPYFHKQDYLAGKFVNTLADDIQKAIAKHGVRNSHHNTIAPTGTISLLANNVSNGIEPIYNAEYQRHVRFGDSTKTYKVADYAYRLWRETNSGLPPQWVDAHQLSPEEHLAIQGAVQPYIDNAISKTINIPKDFPFEKLSEIYTQAYALGLKGCTVFRPNPVTGSVIEVPEERCCQVEL